MGVANAVEKGVALGVGRRRRRKDLANSRHEEVQFGEGYDSSRYQLGVGWTMG